MSVDIEPFELSFRRPFTYEVSQTLTIKNPNTTPVAFKVKTTAPKQYCVRPNAGRIEPGQDFDVTVLLQAMKSEPAPDAKCRDKFLVQSAPITGDKEFASVSSVLETTDKASIQERKIRVIWLPATSDEASGNNSPPPAVTPNRSSISNAGITDTPDASRTFSSPSDNRPSSATPSNAPPPYTDSKKEQDTTPDSKPVEAIKSALENPVAAVVAAKKEKTDTKKDAKKDKTDEGLRQRNVTAGATTVAEKRPMAQAVNPSVQGVPVKITALLCFLAFMIAYLFF